MFLFKAAHSQWKLWPPLHTPCLHSRRVLNAEYVRGGAGAGRAGRAVCIQHGLGIVPWLFECTRSTKERGESRTGSQPSCDGGAS